MSWYIKIFSLTRPLNSKYFSLAMSDITTNKCKVAVCQFTGTNNKAQNLVVVKRLVQTAKEQNAKMAFLPEACDYVAANKEEICDLAEDINGPLVTEYKDIAREKQIWISVGGFHERSSKSAVYNSHILIDDLGNIKSIYRKIHLFDVEIPDKNISLRESSFCTGGDTIVTPINTPAGPLALSICYDMRFPELSTLQRKMGAEILTFPSAFTTVTGAAHWETILRARAIENQCYVIAAAQYGIHNSKRSSYGHSIIIDPWGKIQAECRKYVEGIPTDESMAFAEIDSDYVKKVREEMPVLQHRRNDVYNLCLVPKSNGTIGKNDTFQFADKVIPSNTVFYKSTHCYAFTNIRCVVPGHVLVASLRPVARLIDLSQDEIADIFQAVVKIQRVMEREHNAESSTVCVQDGKNAGQTVPHVHVHILPRRPNDFNRNDDIYTELAKHDSAENLKPIRLLDEMVDEACKLKLHFYSKF